MVLALVFSQVSAFAQGTSDDDISDNLSVTINVVYDGTPLSGEEFKLYKFADLSSDFEISVTDDFKDYPVNLDEMKQDTWQELADIVDAYVKKDNVQPLCVGTTKYNGRLEFTAADGLDWGIYLVEGKTIDLNGKRYTCEPFFVSVPTSNNGVTVAKETVNPKIAQTDIPINYVVKVRKTWDDDGYSKLRPKSVSVQLLCDGEVYDTQKLSKSNNWRYTWENLDPASDWTVVEVNVPDDYTVTLTVEDSTYTLKNTYKENETTTTPSGGGTTTSGTGSSLPKTGLNWLPIPILALCGILFIVIGTIIMKNNRGRKDER
jgi:hypothetical protein